MTIPSRTAARLQRIAAQWKPKRQEQHNVAEVGGVVVIDGQPVAELAKPSCRACHGTGLFGTRLNPDKSRTRLVCPCVLKHLGE